MLKRNKYYEQMSLDQSLFPAGSSPVVEDRVHYNNIPTAISTFKSGNSKSVHCWFRLTPSFGPDLVQIILKKLRCRETDVVLDPFAGAGTTLIECKLNGIHSIGFEINPFLHFVGKTNLNWELDPKTLNDVLNEIVEEFDIKDRRVRTEDLCELALTLPSIHNVTKWWREDVLKQLLLLKKIIFDKKIEKAYRNFFLLSLAGVLVPDLTNVTLGRLQLHFIDRSADDIRVLKTFSAHSKKMISDIKGIQDAT